VETAVYDLELSYLREANGGHAFKGWDSEGGNTAKEEDTEINPEDMVFSKSSLTSPFYLKQGKVQSKKAS